MVFFLASPSIETEDKIAYFFLAIVKNDPILNTCLNYENKAIEYSFLYLNEINFHLKHTEA